MSGYNSATFLLSVLEAAVEMGEVDPFEDTALLYQITPGAVTAGLSVGDLRDMVAEIERLRAITRFCSGPCHAPGVEDAFWVTHPTNPTLDGWSTRGDQ